MFWAAVNNNKNNDNENPFSIRARNYDGTCRYAYDGMFIV